MKTFWSIILSLLVSSMCFGQVDDATCQSPVPSREELFGMVEPKAPEWHKENGFWLHSEVYDDFKRMQKAAYKDSVNLYIVSAFRSFDRQKTIWERKWNSAERSHMEPVERARHILRYSSMPTTSRHHWGTDVDLNSVEFKYFFTKEGNRVLQWLYDHAAEYNFFRPYTEGRPKGYMPEPWHWSHRTSERFLETYLQTVSDTDIKGFEGADTADTLNIIEYWVKLD